MQFSSNYVRARELDDTVEKKVEVVDAYLKEPVHGTIEELMFVRKLCAKWVGKKRRDDLLEALIAMNEAYALKAVAATKFTGNYYGVSLRIVNRPLVILPHLLSAEEEAYFLPHVFNKNVNEGRMDYRDLHGSVLQGGVVAKMEKNGDPRIAAVDTFCHTLRRVAGTLQAMGDSPAGHFFGRMGISLRLYAGIMRSENNFFSAGTVRDRNQEKLMGPPHIPPKVGDWVGDPDLQLLNGYMRDELDNAAEMIELLENGGMRQMVLASKPEDEDTFLLGPDLIGQMKKKCAIMRRHWLDAQAYMSTPHK
jgi:hypothetical protein